MGRESDSGVQMRRPLATVLTLVVVSTLFIGFAAGPAAAVMESPAMMQDCSSTAVGSNSGTATAVTIPQQGAIQINVANSIQAGTAVSVGGDAAVVQNSNIGQSNWADQDQC